MQLSEAQAIATRWALEEDTVSIRWTWFLMQLVDTTFDAKIKCAIVNELYESMILQFPECPTDSIERDTLFAAWMQILRTAHLPNWVTGTTSNETYLNRLSLMGE